MGNRASKKDESVPAKVEDEKRQIHGEAKNEVESAKKLIELSTKVEDAESSNSDNKCDIKLTEDQLTTSKDVKKDGASEVKSNCEESKEGHVHKEKTIEIKTVDVQHPKTEDAQGNKCAGSINVDQPINVEETEKCDNVQKNTSNKESEEKRQIIITDIKDEVKSEDSEKKECEYKETEGKHEHKNEGNEHEHKKEENIDKYEENTNNDNHEDKGIKDEHKEEKNKQEHIEEGTKDEKNKYEHEEEGIKDEHKEENNKQEGNEEKIKDEHKEENIHGGKEEGTKDEHKEIKSEYEHKEEGIEDEHKEKDNKHEHKERDKDEHKDEENKDEHKEGNKNQGTEESKHYDREVDDKYTNEHSTIIQGHQDMKEVLKHDHDEAKTD